MYLLWINRWPFTYPLVLAVKDNIGIRMYFLKESVCQRPINLICSSVILDDAAVVAAPILKLWDLNDVDERPAAVTANCNHLVNWVHDTA